ncbi:MAG: Gfo/Idh/MocA family oxidoreductase [Opitutaceae bacterium]
MSSSPVRLAFIGLGGMGQVAHLRNYVLDPGVTVVAAAELRPELGRRVCERYGIPRLYPDHRELLEKEEVDGIVAIQQFTRHGQIVPELLKQGVPILTEKPLARSWEVGSGILKAAQAARTPLYVAYHKRSDPAVIHARKIMAGWRQNGEFGRLKYIRLTMPPGGWPSPSTGYDPMLRTDEPYPELERDPHGTGLDEKAVARLDAFVNYYIHQVNLMRHLMGEDYSVSYADPAGVVLGVNSVSGVSGTLEMAPYQSASEWQEQAFIAFEKANIRVDIPGPLTADAAGRVTVFRDRFDGTPPETLSPSLPPVHAMRQQAIHFADALRGNPTPLCRAEEALKDLQTAREYMDLFLKTTT